MGAVEFGQVASKRLVLMAGIHDGQELADKLSRCGWIFPAALGSAACWLDWGQEHPPEPWGG
jgi:hypothetical protein